MAERGGSPPIWDGFKDWIRSEGAIATALSGLARPIQAVVQRLVNAVPEEWREAIRPGGHSAGLGTAIHTVGSMTSQYFKGFGRWCSTHRHPVLGALLEETGDAFETFLTLLFAETVAEVGGMASVANPGPATLRTVRLEVVREGLAAYRNALTPDQRKKEIKAVEGKITRIDATAKDVEEVITDAKTRLLNAQNGLGKKRDELQRQEIAETQQRQAVRKAERALRRAAAEVERATLQLRAVPRSPKGQPDLYSDERQDARNRLTTAQSDYTAAKSLVEEEEDSLGRAEEQVARVLRERTEAERELEESRRAHEEATNRLSKLRDDARAAQEALQAVAQKPDKQMVQEAISGQLAILVDAEDEMRRLVEAERQRAQDARQQRIDRSRQTRQEFFTIVKEQVVKPLQEQVEGRQRVAREEERQRRRQWNEDVDRLPFVFAPVKFLLRR